MKLNKGAKSLCTAAAGLPLNRQAFLFPVRHLQSPRESSGRLKGEEMGVLW